VIKPGINVVCGPLPPEAAQVIRETCVARSARFVDASSVELEPITGGRPLSLRGSHQRRNAAIAATLLRGLDARGIAVGPDAMRAALTDVTWPGRLELFRHLGADVLVDAAHNAAGTRALAEYVRDCGWTNAILVFGAMQDKDVGAMLAELAHVFPALICTTAETPRAMDADAIAAIARDLPGASWQVSTVQTPATALETACHASSRVAVAGSIFLIGPLRGILRPR
jgi:dihydrofolate synthase/folylpolyglutamate synthase